MFRLQLLGKQTVSSMTKRSAQYRESYPDQILNGLVYVWLAAVILAWGAAHGLCALGFWAMIHGARLNFAMDTYSIFLLIIGGTTYLACDYGAEKWSAWGKSLEEAAPHTPTRKWLYKLTSAASTVVGFTALIRSTIEIMARNSN